MLVWGRVDRQALHGQNEPWFSERMKLFWFNFPEFFAQRKASFSGFTCRLMRSSKFLGGYEGLCYLICIIICVYLQLDTENQKITTKP